MQGPTVEMLKEEVGKLQIDLLIIGSHKHGLLYEMFVGSTTIDMVKKHSIPMMIIPLPDVDE
nr:universal stress protein [Fulvivirga ulvae]